MKIAFLALAAILAAGHASAESEMLSCQTVNGRTTCVRATGNVSCVTINGDTRCTRLDDRAQPSPPPDLPEIDLPEIDLPCIDIDAAGVRVRTGCLPSEPQE